MHPQKLNGFHVIASAPRKGNIDGALIVLVFRPTNPMPYVVATWAPHMGSEWCWGHYFSTFEDATTDYFSMCDWTDANNFKQRIA